MPAAPSSSSGNDDMELKYDFDEKCYGAREPGGGGKGKPKLYWHGSPAVGKRGWQPYPPSEANKHPEDIPIAKDNTMSKPRGRPPPLGEASFGTVVTHDSTKGMWTTDAGYYWAGSIMLGGSGWTQSEESAMTWVAEGYPKRPKGGKRGRPKGVKQTRLPGEAPRGRRPACGPEHGKSLEWDQEKDAWKTDKGYVWGGSTQAGGTGWTKDDGDDDGKKKKKKSSLGKKV